MRCLLLALPFALLPALAPAHEQHDHDHDHGHSSLGSHKHGAAELDIALDGRVLEVELRSPAMNLLGFEHAPRDDAEERKVAETFAQLQQPDTLFGLPSEAQCELDEANLESPLFAEDSHGHEQHDAGTHSDVHAHYRYSCNAPGALVGLDLQGWFRAFPGIEKIETQLIGPNGQQGKLLRAEQTQITF